MGREPILQEAFSTRFVIKEIAAELGISTAAVSQWTRCPEKHVAVVARITGMPRWRLRPDLYKRPRRRRPQLNGQE